MDMDCSASNSQQSIKPPSKCMERKCGYHECNNQGVRLCPPCQSIAYCSEACQRKDWTTHRNHCIFFHVVPNKQDPSRKNVIAARNLASGTLIVEESSVIVGPKFVSDNSPVCLACCSIISEDMHLCRKCNWPLCSIACETNISHSANECKILSAGNIRHPDVITSQHLFAIILIRFCVARTAFPNLWASLSSLISQLISEGMDNYNGELQNAEAQINFFNMKHLCTPSDWIIMSKIVSTYGFTLKCNVSGKQRSFQGFFPKSSSVFEHSCAPNCFVTMSPKLALKIRTAVDVARGSPLRVAHHPSVLYLGTKARQDHLTELQKFVCKCDRCNDPLELGSHMSTWVCTNCKKSSLVLAYPLQSNERICKECNFTLDASRAENMLVDLEYKLYSQINCPSQDLSGQFVFFLRDVIQSHSESTFHPNHWLLMDCARKIVTFYGEENGVLNSEEDQEMYVQLLKRLLYLNDIIVPGLSRERGKLQYFLGRQSLGKAEFQFNHGQLGRENFSAILNTTDNLYKESLKYFVVDGSEMHAEGSNMHPMVEKIIYERVKVNNLRSQLANSY